MHIYILSSPFGTAPRCVVVALTAWRLPLPWTAYKNIKKKIEKKLKMCKYIEKQHGAFLFLGLHTKTNLIKKIENVQIY